METVASYNVSNVVHIYVFTEYAKALWPYSDVRPCCHQSVHAFTSRYDSSLLARAWFLKIDPVRIVGMRVRVCVCVCVCVRAQGY